MRRPGRLLALVSSVVLLTGSAFQTETVTAWIRASAIRLVTPEAGHGFADMQPLKQVIGNARIVSLGEATHGTREFFQLKHRMLEFLASEMGFTIFSIEASMPEAYRLNDYVLNGTGDPAALLKGMYFWTWDTEEVLDMIRWMREFNASGKGRVQFTGFDMQTPTVAQEIVRGFVARYEPTYATTLQDVAALVAQASFVSPASSIAVANATIPVRLVAGKKVHFTGFIKTEGITRGYAGLWFRANGASGVVAFDNMQNRGAAGTTDWKQYVIDVVVPPTATSIVFGALMPGDGKAWFDDLAIELDGQPYADPAILDMGFESAALRGFTASGSGYRAELDPAVAHGGRQSLRMTYVAAPANAVSSDDARAITARCRDVVTHLEAGRAGYQAGGASAVDVEWTIQNARVVLQGLQMRTNEASRDRSMADNVKWILDRNPGAKIVLWAHNGHVATAGFSDQTMGAALRQAFGREMVVFGFAFNQGSFRAIAQNGSALKDFTVPPLPSDSLDATLASAGIPLFALDIRHAPAWFKEPHGSREIGATYPDGSPDAFTMKFVAPDAFDAILFVEATTAARKNTSR